MNEYYEVAAAAALVGGTVRGTGTIIGGDKAKAEDKAKSTEQDEDLRTEIQSAKVMAVFISFISNNLPSFASTLVCIFSASAFFMASLTF